MSRATNYIQTSRSMSRDQTCRQSPSTNRDFIPGSRIDESSQQTTSVSENQINPTLSDTQGQDASGNTNICVGCGHLIFDRILFSAMDQKWHNACLRCHCCGGRLAEMGTSLFNRGNMILCRQDYLK